MQVRAMNRLSHEGRRRRRAWAAGLLLMWVLAGCKQGEGEVCQINDDCEDGLDCNAGTGRCQRPGGAPTFDAGTPTPDAMVDAAVDAGIDAGP
jgi:hypothetical protein